MKKLKVLLGAVALIASMALVSCGDPVNSTTGDGSGASTVPTEDLVLFEGNKVINASGYDNVINFTSPVAAGSGYKKFKIEASWESADGIQVQAQMKNGNNQSSETISLNKDGAIVEGNCFVGATYKDWDNGGADANCADGATQIQFFVQDSSYQPTTGTITVKKIWLVGNN